MATAYLELTASCCQPQELHSGEHREGASGSAEDGLCWDEAELPAQGPELSVDSHRGNCQPAGPMSGWVLEGDPSQGDRICKNARFSGQPDYQVTPANVVSPVRWVSRRTASDSCSPPADS